MPERIFVCGIVLLAAAALLHAQAVVRVQARAQVRTDAEPSQPGPGTSIEPVDPTPEEWAQIDDLIRQLGAARLVVRDRAMSEIAQFGPRALGQVREALKHDDDEIVWRCTLLEEVILSGQGELFLAARNLGISIAELNAYLADRDVTALLHVMRTQGQPGMAPLWSRILGRAADQPQLFIAGELCRDMEGPGYGNALLLAALRAEEPAVDGLALLTAMLPPASASDAVEVMARLRQRAGVDDLALRTTRQLRGEYKPEQTLAARGGRLLPNTPEAAGIAEWRLALALHLTPACTPEQLAGADLPAPETMSAVTLQAWLELLARSGMTQRLRDAMMGLTEPRQVGMAAGLYASIAPLDEIVALYHELPLAARVAVLDAWWAAPREPARMHAFLLHLVETAEPAVRHAALALLGQFRAPSTAAVLARAALADASAAPVALRSLRPMADLLVEAELNLLINALGRAKLRRGISQVLAASGDPAARDALLADWRRELRREEIPTAIATLARDPASPAGAWSATRLMEPHVPRTFVSHLAQQRSGEHGDPDVVMLRALLTLPEEAGFTLLQKLAGDIEDSTRFHAMTALALAGRDEALAEGWLRRLEGEVPDPLQALFAWPLTFSATPAGEAFRRQAIQRGADSAHLPWLLTGVATGLGPIQDSGQLLSAVLQSPDGARQHHSLWRHAPQGLSSRAAQNLIRVTVFRPAGVGNDAAFALWMRDSGVDVLDVLYGAAGNAAPGDPGQCLTVAFFGDPQRAYEILKRAELPADGSFWVPVRFGKAWLGMLDDAENKRARRVLAQGQSSVARALILAGRADHGDTAALRSLLDSFSPVSALMQQQDSGAVVRQTRRGGAAFVAHGAAGALAAPHHQGTTLPAQLLQSWLPEPPSDWGDWWLSRRALLEWDGTAYKFVELP